MLNLKEAQKLKQRSPMFHAKTAGNFILFSYHFVDPSVFQAVPASRELRGIIFDATTGEIVARPFPKFFNLGEPACTVDEGSVVSANEKIDGSLVTAFIADDNIRLASKGSFNSWVVSEATQALTGNHKRLIRDCYAKRYTPIFEYVSRENPIVIQYPRSELIFIGARNIDSGEMKLPREIETIARKFQVPYARVQFENERAGSIRDGLRDERGMEGLVVYEDNRNIAKVKTAWYVALNKFNAFSLKTEKQIRKAFFDQKIDDVYPLLPEATKSRVDEVVAKITRRMQKRTSEVKEFFKTEGVAALSRKDFTLLVQRKVEPSQRGIYFAIRFYGKTVEEAVFEYFRGKK